MLAGVSACSGTAEPGSSASASAEQEQALKFAQCMRDHGVDMPDPQDGHIVTGQGASPGSINGSGNGSDTLDLGAGGEAFEACREFMPDGGEPRKLTAGELEQMLKFAQCMRAHGIDYPDPNPDGVQQGFGVPMDDPAAMQRLDEAVRACDALNNSTSTP